MSTRTKNEAPMGASAPICIGRLSIAPRFRNCKRGQGNFLHFGRSTKNTRRFWAKWRKIRASLRPWPPLGGGCRRSRLGERNYVLRLSLRRPTGDTSLTEGGKREGRGSAPPETLCKIGGRGRAPPLRAVLRRRGGKPSLPPSPCRRHLPHRGRQAGGAGFYPARNIVQNRREG